MKTLIWNGSPRNRGDTAALLRQLRTFLPGEAAEVKAYSSKIAPCTDCQYCWEQDGCAQKDGWQALEKELLTCGAVVIASPIYFSELPGPLLSVLSRLQQYYCGSAFRGKTSPLHGKRGGLILVGGGDGSPRRARETAETLLHQMGCESIFPAVVCHNTNAAPALDEPGVSKKLRELAEFLSGKN